MVCGFWRPRTFFSLHPHPRHKLTGRTARHARRDALLTRRIRFGQLVPAQREALGRVAQAIEECGGPSDLPERRAQVIGRDECVEDVLRGDVIYRARTS